MRPFNALDAFNPVLHSIGQVIIYVYGSEQLMHLYAVTVLLADLLHTSFILVGFDTLQFFCFFVDSPPKDRTPDLQQVSVSTTLPTSYL